MNTYQEKNRSFTTKIGLQEMIMDRHVLMGPATTIAKKETDNIWNMGITRDINFSRQVLFLPL